MKSVNINGQYTATELEDAQGAFTLTPAPAGGFDPIARDWYYALIAENADPLFGRHRAR